jgi:hypothetical protein
MQATAELLKEIAIQKMGATESLLLKVIQGAECLRTRINGVDTTITGIATTTSVTTTTATVIAATITTTTHINMSVISVAGRMCHGCVTTPSPNPKPEDSRKHGTQR